MLFLPLLLFLLLTNYALSAGIADINFIVYSLFFLFIEVTPGLVLCLAVTPFLKRPFACPLVLNPVSLLLMATEGAIAAANWYVLCSSWHRLYCCLKACCLAVFLSWMKPLEKLLLLLTLLRHRKYFWISFYMLVQEDSLL
ncbi:hypothetical protein AMECASPLE_033173 [Ameca splendens]|uniref:Uncharacterized protein n=1 Tax=Ameca splendens TaxID=208324 RepID=A0ABV1AD68_9TELE